MDLKEHSSSSLNSSSPTPEEEVNLTPLWGACFSLPSYAINWHCYRISPLIHGIIMQIIMNITIMTQTTMHLPPHYWKKDLRDMWTSACQSIFISC